MIHTFNDERQLGRTLETLHPAMRSHCGSRFERPDSADRAAVWSEGPTSRAGVQDGAYATDCKHDWVLCLLPTETLTETLEASLLEWKTSKDTDDVAAYALGIRRNGENASQSLGS